MRALHEFGTFSGLKVNMQKSFAILKRQSGPVPQRYVGLTVKDRVRYLGLQIRDVNAEQAYAALMAKMKARAAFLKTLPLEFQEKAEIFRIGIQPVVQAAKSYEPSKKVLSALNVMFKKALGLSSWDLSPAMVAQPVNRGGVATYPMAVWVRYQFGQLFQSILKDKL